MSAVVDVVTVFHRDENHLLALDLKTQIERYEDLIPWNFIGVDNREVNRGFAKGCNYGARKGQAPVIAFLNPDVKVTGPIFAKVIDALSGDSGCVITGSNFGKRPNEYERIWGCREWVCGAAFFVRRDFFTTMAGFDERYVWGWEETDLIRRAQIQILDRKPVKAITLPIAHASPDDNPVEDVIYKNKHFNEGAARFFRQWKRGH